MRRCGWLVGLCLSFGWKVLGGPGFIPWEQATQLPPPVSAAGDGVYRIIIFGKQPTPLRPEQIAAHLAGIEARSTKGTNPPLYRWEAENYFTEQGGISYPLIGGTAFLLNDNRTIITNRSLFDELRGYEPAFIYARTYRASQAALSRFPLDFALVDRHGEIVFSSRKTNGPLPAGAVMRARFNGHISALSAMGPEYHVHDYTSGNMLTDHVQLELTQSLPGTPLRFAAAKPPYRDAIYCLSYPHPTTGRKHNSFGKTLYVSSGKRVQAPIDYQQFLSRLFQNQRMTETFLASRLFYDADIADGASGAPLLNQQGEVVGLANLGWSKTPLSHWDARGAHGLCVQHLMKMMESAETHPDAIGLFFVPR